MSLQMPAGYPASNPSATSPSTPQSTYVNNLSSKYGLTNLNGNQTVYDKSTNTPFSNAADFFKASGTNSFDGLQFDTNYKPPSPLDAARQTYLNSLNPSSELTGAKTAYNNFINNEQSGLNRISDKAIPMTFITGQQASLRRNSEATATRLQQDIGLAEDNSKLAQEKAQAALGFAQDDVLNKDSNKLSSGLPFYKYAGSDQVFDAKTNQPLTYEQYKAAGGVGMPGQAQFGDVNVASASGTTALNTNKLLSVTEAKALGVPYGTTEAQAAALGITPTGKGSGPGGGGGGSSLTSTQSKSILDGIKSGWAAEGYIQGNGKISSSDYKASKADFRAAGGTGAQFDAAMKALIDTSGSDWQSQYGYGS